MWVSSAYWWWPTPNCSATFDVGDMYAACSRGPSTNPCGTPHGHWLITDDEDQSWTNCLRSVRYDLSKLIEHLELQSCAQVEIITRIAQPYQTLYCNEKTTAVEMVVSLKLIRSRLPVTILVNRVFRMHALYVVRCLPLPPELVSLSGQPVIVCITFVC